MHEEFIFVGVGGVGNKAIWDGTCFRPPFPTFCPCTYTRTHACIQAHTHAHSISCYIEYVFNHLVKQRTL